MNQSTPPTKKSAPALWALYILLALIAAAPLWGPGMVNTRGGGDSPFLLQRTLDMAENLRHGIFPPRWMPTAAYDMGYPMFNHYAALPYYLSGGLAALGVSPLLAIQATQTLGFVLAALAMGLWAERVYRQPGARVLAVLAYTFAPFHLVNVYVRGDSLSEFYAFIWYPLILWALDTMTERANAKRVLVAAAAYGALILTHNVSAMNFSPFALLYALLAQIRQQHGQTRPFWSTPRSFLRSASLILAPFVLGFLLSAWFWLPAILETSYGQMGEAFTAGYFHYTNHFRTLNLVQPALAFDYDIAIHASEAGPFAMGAAQAVLAVSGAGALLLGAMRKEQHPAQPDKTSALFLIFGLALASVMITPLSKPLWDHLPLLEKSQFPWRFLSIQALFTAMASGALLAGADKKATPLTWVAGLRLAGGALAGALLIGSVMWNLRPERLAITAQDVTRENLLLYETFSGNIGTTIRYEYLPQDVVPRPYISAAVIDGEGTPQNEDGSPLEASRNARTPVREKWSVTLTQDAAVSFPLNWWPGWQARADGKPYPAYPQTGSGLLSVDLPAGTHNVTLKLTNTPLRTLALLISGGALAAGLFFAFKDKTPLELPRQAMIATGIGLAVSLVLPAICGRSTPANATFFDFERLPYPHAGPLDFGPARLEDIAFSTGRGAPGARISITPTWTVSTAEPLTATLRLVSPAEPRHGVPYALAETHCTLPCDPAPVLELPADISRGLYLLQLSVFDSAGEIRARTAQGHGTGAVFVGAIRVPQGPPLPADAPVLAEFRDLTLHSITPTQTSPENLRIKMQWSGAGTPRNWTLSLRLYDTDGRQIVQRDLEPGYGYLPTSLWHAGELVSDYPVLPLPEGLAPGDYVLHVISYLRATMEGGGETQIPLRINAVTRKELPGDSEATILCESGGVALLETSLPAEFSEGRPLEFEAIWNAQQAPRQEISAIWTLEGSGGAVVGQSSGPLATGSHTAEWPQHAWVKAPVRIELPPLLDEGDYRLKLTLHTPGAASESACTLPNTLSLLARPRIFTAPDITHPQIADFADAIRLLGYDLEQDTANVTLTLWWQAQRPLERDYKRFVHLYDPATEAIFDQNDAMPRDWSYPTTWWAAGEVVSETLSLDISSVTSAVYHIAVGWYDPQSSLRLPVSDPSATPYPLDRVVLIDK